MSQVLIQQYLNQLQDLRKVSGTHRESVVREAFKDLLKGYARQHDLVFIPEYEIATPAKDRRYVDGALLHALRVPFGYWEAKDDKDDLNAEIEYKFKRGYPRDNIIFEDSREAVLIQNAGEVMRCAVDDTEDLAKLLGLFFGYQRPEIAQFRRAVEQFKADLPAVLESLRAMIDGAYRENPTFAEAAVAFLKHAQEAINPSLIEADVREMLIQHILTEEIFSKVFDESDFHRQNNVAKELYALESQFFTGDLKKRTLKGLEAYYAAIRAAAAQIGTHQQKQTFLKVIYENFYKVYNAKAADRLGVVYTPNEIVRFMIESADWLCEKHFGRNLIDKDVEILDPATGTGTFICELLEHFRGQPKKLERKYAEELHANEVAILPYYVANLNIEATYAAIMGKYEEFPSLCFVDTLDNVGLHTQAHGTNLDLFGSVSEENVARIRRQNTRKISVIIGNPPYNVNQLNENDNNKNREYPNVDRRIKDTYIAESTAQKTKRYDMYSRFFRWASDRLSTDGVLAFITNRNYIDSREADGFRKTVVKEFSEAYVFDLGGDVRANPKLSGTKHNVFGIQTGVAISFLVKKAKPSRSGKKEGEQHCRIYYARRPEMETAEEKLAFLSSHRLETTGCEEVRPDKKHNWINLTSNDFESLMPTGTKAAKKSSSINPKVIFKLFSQGVKTNRDEWVWGFSRAGVLDRVRYLEESYNAQQRNLDIRTTSENVAARLNYDIKWTRKLKKQVVSRRPLVIDPQLAISALFRPFMKKTLYFSSELNEDWYQLASIFRTDEHNPTIAFLSVFSSNPLTAMAVNGPFDYCLLKMGNGGTECLPFWRYEADGRKVENITDWALKQFKDCYKTTPSPQPSPVGGRGNKTKAQAITKEAIFHYVYAVLHDPVYRETYAQNLKREFPRIPMHDDFRRWADWGEALMGLHIGYESVEPFALARIDIADEKARAVGQSPKPILKADKVAGRIALDSETTLSGIPPAAWDYKLGNRSALEWILDQHKEKTPKDPTIRAKFNTYQFADYKEKVIDLIARVTRVSVETQIIVAAMQNLSR